MSYSQPSLGVDLWSAGTSLVGKGIDYFAGGPQQRERRRATEARTKDVQRQTDEARAAAQAQSDTAMQEASRRVAEMEATAAAEAAARKKKLMMQLGIGGAAVVGVGALLWFVTRD